MAHLLAYLPVPGTLDRLERAVQIGDPRARHTVASASSWGHVLRIAERSPPHLLIVDPYASGCLDADSIKAFRERYCRISVLAYGRFGENGARDAVVLIQIGVCEIIFMDREDTPTAIMRYVSKALSYSMLGEVIGELDGVIPAELVPGFHRLLAAAQEPVTPHWAACTAFFCHPNTLARRLDAAGLPSVNKLIVWIRLLYAASLLENRHRTIESVALALGYSSVSGLRDQIATICGRDTARTAGRRP